MSRARFLPLPVIPAAPRSAGRPAPEGASLPIPAAPRPADRPAPEQANSPDPAASRSAGTPATDAGILRVPDTRRSAGRPAPEQANSPDPATPVARRIPVLRLAGTVTAGEASRLTRAVLARVTQPGVQVGTVVLDLGCGAGIDTQARESLCALWTALRRRGTKLRLVITSAKARDALAAGLAHRIGPDLLHPTLRAAVLASYAEVPGPGLVTAGVRAALAVPAEPVRALPAALPRRARIPRFTHYGWGAPRAAVAGLGSPERT